MAFIHDSMRGIFTLILVVLVVTVGISEVLAQSETGSIEGRVSLRRSGKPLHDATVMIVQSGETTTTDDDGNFRFTDVPVGMYDVMAWVSALTSETVLIEVRPGESTSVNIELEVSPIKQEITVTATGQEQTAFESVQKVTSLDSFDLSDQMAPSLGEVLDNRPGLAKRSFGPGSARPVIRGFDGDRVLIMKDGLRIGSLASQSGDHGEPIDPTQIERLEVVKGPATLLYGSNAIGGVVNAISGHHELHERPHQGLRGHLSSVVGSNGGHFGTSVEAEYGTDHWLFWGGGGGQRRGDYDTPIGEMDNSKTRISNGMTGLGWYGQRFFASGEYLFADGRYGIPFAGEFHDHSGSEGPDQEFEQEEGQAPEEEELADVDVSYRHHFVRATTGINQLGPAVESFKFSVSYTDWSHRELEVGPGDKERVGTIFDNQQFVYRGVFEQARKGVLAGSFGFWGMLRDYEAVGEEALSPPVDQNAFALFTLQEINLERVKLHLGARLEHTRYEPRGFVERVHENGAGNEEEGESRELVSLPSRKFTGASAGIGARFSLWREGAFVANYTNSFRAPALEELYNFGPHIGNLAFEVGNPNLQRERSHGFDFSLRQFGSGARGELNFFVYNIDDFVFLAPTGGAVDGLIEAEFDQADSRYVGAEAGLDLRLIPSLWLNLGMDLVDAKITETDTPLPRIPPLRGRFGVDFRHQGFSIKPEMIVAADQDDIFQTETRTPGYAVFNLKASYTLPQQHFTHHFSFNVFNIGDRLYRNHLSFIKELAPEMGRGVRFAYVMKFF